MRGEDKAFPHCTIQAKTQNLFKAALVKGMLMVRMEWATPTPVQDGPKSGVRLPFPFFFNFF